MECLLLVISTARVSMNELQQKLARRRSLNGESIDPSVAAAARESVRVGKPVSPTKSDAGPETTVITAVTVAETPTVLSPRPESGEEKSSEKNNAPVDTSQALKLDKNEKELVVDVLKGEDEVAGEESNTTKKTQHNLTDSSAGLADLEKEDTEETLVDTYSTERTSDENSDCVVAVVNSTTSAPLFTEEITLVANRLQVMPSSVKLEKLIEELTTTDVSESSNLNASERSQLEAKAVLSKVESITTNDHPLRLTFLYSSSQNRANSDSEYDYESGKFSSNSSRTASERLAGDDGVINAAYRGYITSMDALINSRGESVKIDRKPWTPVVDFVKSRLPVKSPKRPFPTLSYHDHENSSIGSTSSHNNVANAKPMDNTDKAISDEPTKVSFPSLLFPLPRLYLEVSYTSRSISENMKVLIASCD